MRAQINLKRHLLYNKWALISFPWLEWIAREYKFSIGCCLILSIV